VHSYERYLVCIFLEKKIAFLLFCFDAAFFATLSNVVYFLSVFCVFVGALLILV